MRIAIPLLALALSMTASAAEPAFTKQYDDCQERSDGGGPAERIECMNAEIKRQGAQLDAAYRAALQVTPAPKQAKLREAQRDWLKFLDANCELFNNPESGSPAEARAFCVMRMTSERKAELAGIVRARQQ